MAGYRDVRARSVITPNRCGVGGGFPERRRRRLGRRRRRLGRRPRTINNVVMLLFLINTGPARSRTSVGPRSGPEEITHTSDRYFSAGQRSPVSLFHVLIITRACTYITRIRYCCWVCYCTTVRRARRQR